MRKKTLVHLVMSGVTEDLGDFLEKKGSTNYTKIILFSEIYNKYGIYTHIFYKGSVKVKDSILKELKNKGIIFSSYKNEEDFIEKLINISKDFEIEYIDTISESLLDLVFKARKELGLIVSKNQEMLSNKYLQRKKLSEYNIELGVKFKEGRVNEFDIDEVEKNIGYPFVIKPVNGSESSGVAEINSINDFDRYKNEYENLHRSLIKNKGFDNDLFLIEEFVDGKMFSIDYFVKKDGSVIITKPVEVVLGIDIGIDDFCNVTRMITKKTQEIFNNIDLDSFIKENVEALGLLNTFVHHEFKINSKGKLKTIEINGRIGGYRLDMYKGVYGINMYELLFTDNIKIGKIQKNYIIIHIYSNKRGILRGFNEDLYNDIRALDTYNYDFGVESFINNEVGLTKYGFIKVGQIRLLSEDYEKIVKDYDFIINNYNKLLIV